MIRYYRSTVFMLILALCISTLHAAAVSWQSSTASAPWVDKGTMETAAWDNDNTNSIIVDEKNTCQEIYGFGGCFNERGWDMISALSLVGQDSVMRALFDTLTGCKFSICRTPIGATDYSVNDYSLDDNAGDYTMSKFSIDRDRQRMIPFIKAAMALRPDLKIWASPWSPPGWMKTSGTIKTGDIKSDAQTFTALALYFEKFALAYRAEGIRLFAIHHQNEPWWGNWPYPTCHWTAEQYRDFVKNYLGPKFKQDDIPVENWAGTMCCDDGAPYIPVVFRDTIANSFCTGVGVQYATKGVLWARDTFPLKRAFQTETPAGGGNNNWTYAEENYDNMVLYIRTVFVNAYMQWNMVLDPAGVSEMGSAQCAPITIDKNTKKVTYNPQYYQVKHFSYYVKPHALHIATTGTWADQIAFKNPDGENVLVVENKGNANATVAINLNGQKIKPTLPAHSFNTFRTAGTPLADSTPYTQVQAAMYTGQSGTFNKPCSEGGTCISLIHNNDWVYYYHFDFSKDAAAATSFQARVAGTAGGSIEIRLDSVTAAPVGTCTVDPTGGATTWKTVSCDLKTPIVGKHVLYLKFKGNGTGNDAASNLFNLSWWKFVPGSAGVKTSGTAKEYGSSVKVVYSAGKKQALQVDFSQLFTKDNVNICLYDLSGRLVTTLFSGRLSSQHLALTLNRLITVPGTYLVNISMNNTVIKTKNLELFN